MSKPYWIGVDVGGTKILTGLFDSEFRLLSQVKHPTHPQQGGVAVFERVVHSIDNVIHEANIEFDRVKAVGLAIPGQILPHTKTVRFAPNLGWRDFDLTPLFPKTWKFDVFLENDVRMGTYGEWVFGAAHGANHVLGIFMGTGIGGGLILNSKLYNGFNGHAGEIGHIVLDWKKSHSLEKLAGRKELMKRIKRKLAKAPKKIRKEWRDIDVENVKSSLLSELYLENEPLVVEAIGRSALVMGSAIGSMVNLLSPEVIVLGGGVVNALGDPFVEHIWEIAQTHILPRAIENVRCVKASLGDNSGIFGAAGFASHSLKEIV